MKDILIKRNKLKEDAMKLREVKFDEKISKSHGMELNKEQDKLWNKFIFYDNFIKAKDKERGK